MTMQQRILIADDEETFRESTSAILADAGYACSSARDAVEAERLLENGFDLLLADVRMPGNAQLELLEVVAKRHPDLPVVVVTGYPTVGTAIESFRLSIVDYLIKPVDLDELKRAVERGLRRGILTRAVKDAMTETAKVAGLFDRLGRSITQHGRSGDHLEWSAQEYMAQRHPEYVQEKLGTGSQRDVFDQVYTYTDPETGVEKFIIVEAKGGKSPLGSRRVHGGGKRAEQGTREYFDEIVAKMTSSENPDIRRVGEKLTLVENPEEVVKYLHVETAIEKGSTGDGGGPGSSIKQISGREFDLHPDVHNDKQGTQ